MGLGELLNSLKLWAEGIISNLGYPGLYLVMFLENVFPPIPSEAVLPLAGSLTLVGRFSIPLVTLVGMLGSLTGAFLFYGLGSWLGEPRVRLLISKYGKYALLTTEDWDKSLSWFRRYGDWVIFFGRMVPIVRSLISIPAGISSMNLFKFIPLTVVGTALWSFLLSMGGRLLGEQWPLIAGWIDAYQNVVLILGILVVAGFVLLRLPKWKKKEIS
jgi:membrane protein DedA with SNARE-associated domain